jgi:excisionase family DNA binding protein
MSTDSDVSPSYVPALGERLLSADEVAEYLGVQRATVLDLSQGRHGPNQLRAIHINKRVVRFHPEDVKAYVDAQRAASAPMLRDQLELRRAPSPARRRRPA